MLPLFAIVGYAVLLIGVRLVVRACSGRPLVPVPDPALGDYIPSYTLLLFVMGSLSLAWIASYRPAPGLDDLTADAVAGIGSFMLFILWIIREKFRVVGFEGRKEVFWAGIFFFAIGAMIANRVALMHLTALS